MSESRPPFLGSRSARSFRSCPRAPTEGRSFPLAPRCDVWAGAHHRVLGLPPRGLDAAKIARAKSSEDSDRSRVRVVLLSVFAPCRCAFGAGCATGSSSQRCAPQPTRWGRGAFSRRRRARCGGSSSLSVTLGDASSLVCRRAKRGDVSAQTPHPCRWGEKGVGGTNPMTTAPKKNNDHAITRSIPTQADGACVPAPGDWVAFARNVPKRQDAKARLHPAHRRVPHPAPPARWSVARAARPATAGCGVHARASQHDHARRPGRGVPGVRASVAVDALARFLPFSLSCYAAGQGFPRSFSGGKVCRRSVWASDAA